MTKKPTYEELEQRIRELELEVAGHKQSDREMLESEKDKYHKLIQDSREAIVIVQGNEIKFANKAALRMWGYQDEEGIMSAKMTDMIAPEGREIMLKRGESREKGNDVPSKYEFRALRKDGTEFLAELSANRIIYRGTVARQAVIRDITEHKRAEEALQKSEERYRLLAENVSDIIWTMDMNMNFTYFSPSVTRLQGFTVEEALTRSVQESMTPASFDIVVKAIAEELEIHDKRLKPLDRSRKVEVELFRKDGSTLWAEVEARFIYDENDQPKSIIGVTRDITDRKLAEEALKKSEKKYRLLAENANDVIWTTDLNLKTTYISPSIESLRGYTPQEVLNQRIEDILTPDSLEYAVETMAYMSEQAEKGMRLHDPFLIELEYCCRDGSTVWVENKISPLRNNEGTIIGLFGISRDITQRKRTEQQLLRSEKLASLGSMVAGVAHEISTPLSVSVISASYLNDATHEFGKLWNSAEVENSKVKRYVDKATEASSMILFNLKRSIDLLDSFKQVAVDRIVEERRDFNLKTNIEDTLRSLSPRFKRSAHTVKVECPDGLEVNSYPGAFSQIVTNLVINSVNHGFEGIEKGEMVLTVGTKDNTLHFRFRDTGKGMDEATLHKLFDPFFTTKRSKGGVGLGMHIVHNLVYQTLGGRIECKSALGKGTEFLIEIPIGRVNR